MEGILKYFFSDGFAILGQTLAGKKGKKTQNSLKLENTQTCRVPEKQKRRA